MPRNIELKAQLSSSAELQCLMSRSEAMTRTKAKVIEQRDVFFNVTEGRMKLRYLSIDTIAQASQLIFYRRNDQTEAKLSEFRVTEMKDIEEARGLEQTLIMAFGKKGEVKKTRHLQLLGQTRIHLDEVERLGYFVELEVCLEDDQTQEEGKKIADEIFDKLLNDNTNDDNGGIEAKLIQGAYMDLILNKIDSTLANSD